MDLGEHTPLAGVGPTRSPSGVREDGRLLSSIEQTDEAVRWMLQQAERKQDRPELVEAKIHWAHRPTSRLRVTIDYEHTPRHELIAAVRTVVEIDLTTMDVIERSPEQLVKEMRDEAASLEKRGY